MAATLNPSWSSIDGEETISPALVQRSSLAQILAFDTDNESLRVELEFSGGEPQLEDTIKPIDIERLNH